MRLAEGMGFNPDAFHTDFGKSPGDKKRKYSHGQSSSTHHRITTSAQLNSPVVHGFRAYEDGETVFNVHAEKNPEARRLVHNITAGTVILARSADFDLSTVRTPTGEKVVKKYLKTMYYGKRYGGELEWLDTGSGLLWEDTDHNMLVGYSCGWQGEGVQYPTLEGKPLSTSRIQVGVVNRGKKKQDMANWLGKTLELGRVSDQLGVQPCDQMCRRRWGGIAMPMREAVARAKSLGPNDGAVACAFYRHKGEFTKYLTDTCWLDRTNVSHLVRVMP